MKRLVFIVILLMFSITMVKAETINLTEMPLDKKIAQMLFLRGDTFYPEYLEMGIGGYFLDQGDNKDYYKELIKKYNDSEIKPFFATDLEGAWNPLEAFFKSKTFGEIHDGKEAYELGENHSIILKELGFNMDFSPVVEIKNNIWPARSFYGEKNETIEKISGYVKGLEENGIMATAKHYPGGSLVKNPHFFRIRVKESELEPEMFHAAITSNVSAVMIAHTILYKNQSTIDPDTIHQLKEDFHGLVITDDITMFGLTNSYLIKNKKLMKDLFSAGNDLILWVGMAKPFYPYPKKVEKTINRLVKKVEDGKIDETRIDESVEKILRYKGYKVIF